MQAHEAIGASIAGLRREQLESIAVACDSAVPTLYQWADGTRAPRLDQVAKFCAATGKDLLIQAIALEAQSIKKGQLALPGTVTHLDLMREHNDIGRVLIAAIADNIITVAEIKAVCREANEFVWSWLSYCACLGKQSKTPAPKRARTLADADAVKS
jgi:hypothetical protein